MTKLVVLYKEPKDRSQFDKYYVEKHAPLASKLPGLKDYHCGPAKGPDGGAAPYYWLFSATFDSAQAIGESLGSDYGKTVLADIPNYYHEAPVVLIVEDV
jgi:uncharacterized protein (TIGR02118 family)